MLLDLDAGELPDESPELWALFDVLHVACGGHAGDAASMARVVAFCAARPGVHALGAHPSYPDRAQFGRRSLASGPDAIDRGVLATSLVEQCAALAAIAAAHGIAVASVKPHGALYHDAARDPELAALVVRAAIAALGPAITVVGPPGHLQGAAAELGVRYAVEGFADRRARPDGTLVPRGEPDALITAPAEAAARAVAIAAEGRVAMLCLHADTPGALAIARAVRAALHDHARTAAEAARGSAAWTWLGDRAIRFARPAGVPARALVEAIRAWPGVVDVVVARHDVAAYFAAPAQVRDADLQALAALRGRDVPAREHELRATYDGPDLDAVARATGLTTDEVIYTHREAIYVVDAIGFAPGFAYLTGLDPRLHVPRRATPRHRVPAGSLAIAGEHTAVYPFASPGGWHLIGRVAERMFDEHGARLALGDRVRFVR